MGLTEYRKKRNFRRTAEPEGNKGSAGKKGKKKSHLIFVVQQHAASHLHYDFRLEMEGVLKSWAVPKGPSMNPDDKRLAMKVEDHPFGYKDFEGIIPEGNYGAGSVIVWDNGWYHLPEHSAQEGDEEKTLLEGLKKGHISFVLEGKKLKGEFSLIHVKGRQENSWLLIKKKDEYATTEDIREKNRSVKSNKKLEDIKGPSPAQRKTSRNSVSRKTSSQGIQPKKKKSRQNKAHAGRKNRTSV